MHIHKAYMTRFRTISLENLDALVPHLDRFERVRSMRSTHAVAQVPSSRRRQSL